MSFKNIVKKRQALWNHIQILKPCSCLKDQCDNMKFFIQKLQIKIFSDLFLKVWKNYKKLCFGIPQNAWNTLYLKTENLQYFKIHFLIFNWIPVDRKSINIWFDLILTQMRPQFLMEAICRGLRVLRSEGRSPDTWSAKLVENAQLGRCGLHKSHGIDCEWRFALSK